VPTPERAGTPPTPDGILVVDKPPGWTSHDVVARARRLCATRKVGHAGTLDPMATGVLVLGVGRATRLLTFLVGCDKDYTATIRLGQATLTDDAEGDVTASAGAFGVTPDAVRAAVAALTGDIEQVPSAVSAIKVKGERAYHRVRGGETVELAARPVTVSRFVVGDARAGDVDGIAVLDVDVEVTVSTGTYVRALARDLGTALGCGGHLTALRRTRVGGFTIADAHPLAGLEARQGERMPVTLLADAARAAFAVREIDDAQARTLGHGQRLESAVPGRTEPVAAIAPDGTLVAMLDESRPTARSLVVFAPASS
jgi:tRNA pseudouridine55 synthase